MELILLLLLFFFFKEPRNSSRIHASAQYRTEEKFKTEKNCNINQFRLIGSESVKKGSK